MENVTSVLAVVKSYVGRPDVEWDIELRGPDNILLSITPKDAVRVEFSLYPVEAEELITILDRYADEKGTLVFDEFLDTMTIIHNQAADLQ